MEAGSHYDVLGVSRAATASEIKRAYRTLALRWHPDKHPPKDRAKAEARFVRVAAACECLSDARARDAYDRRGTAIRPSHHAAPCGGVPFDFFRASQLFRENFGESLAADWRPGQRVHGTLVRGGKRVSVTIHLDGTSEEREESTLGGDYTYVSRSGAGGSFTSVHITGSLGKALTGMIVPQTMQRVPLVGPVVTTAVEWLPTAVCLGCCYVCCCRDGAGSPGQHSHGA
jgi:hypothetical protein